jgi:hypothetical protein
MYAYVQGRAGRLGAILGCRGTPFVRLEERPVTARAKAMTTAASVRFAAKESTASPRAVPSGTDTQ